MFRRLVLSAFLALILSGGAFAQESVPTADSGENSQPSEAPKGNSSILFSAEGKSPDSEGRVVVAPGDKLHVCVKLDQEAMPLFKQLVRDGIGFRLILEDSVEPPHVLTITLGNRIKKMLPDSQGCVGGNFPIPQDTATGIYQVSDLLMATYDQSYYSVRDYLFDFGQVDELKIENPKDDLKPPELVKIETFHTPLRKLRIASREVRIKLDQQFFFKDEGTGVDPSSLKVFYSLLLDDAPGGYAEAKCRQKHPEKYFICKLNIVRPEWDWGLLRVQVTLNSVTIRDMAGNKLAIADPEELKSKVADGVMSFQYDPFLQNGSPHRYNLNRDKLY